MFLLPEGKLFIVAHLQKGFKGLLINCTTIGKIKNCLLKAVKQIILKSMKTEYWENEFRKNVSKLRARI